MIWLSMHKYYLTLYPISKCFGVYQIFFLLIISALDIFWKNFVKNLLKKFANQKICSTFVSGLRKWGSLNGINLLVISFSVINYVVSRASACEGRRFFFYFPLSQPSIHAAPYGNADAVEAKPLSHSKLHKCLGLPVIPNNPITHWHTNT